MLLPGREWLHQVHPRAGRPGHPLLRPRPRMRGPLRPLHRLLLRLRPGAGGPRDRGPGPQPGPHAADRGLHPEASGLAAIQKGEDLRDTVEAALLATPLRTEDAAAVDALELLAWMVAKRSPGREGGRALRRAAARPIAGVGLFHEKAGIIEDAEGNRLAFSGSINETEFGWKHNWESFHVYTTWTGGTAARRGRGGELSAPLGRQGRQRHRHGRAGRGAPGAAQVPAEARPARPAEEGPRQALSHPSSRRRMVPGTPESPRARIWTGAAWSGASSGTPRAWPDGGERIGEATSAVTPWPHQVRAFQRLYDQWPPRLLIADEVGLGKTIQAGMLLRQAWLSGRAKRILVLAPKAVLSQWQIELREKFNLNWPIYDGQRLSWYPSPGFQGAVSARSAPSEWHREPCVLASSHLMRRGDRAAGAAERGGALGPGGAGRGPPRPPRRRRPGHGPAPEPAPAPDAGPARPRPGPGAADRHAHAGEPGGGLGPAGPAGPARRSGTRRPSWTSSTTPRGPARPTSSSGGWRSCSVPPSRCTGPCRTTRRCAVCCPA